MSLDFLTLRHPQLHSKALLRQAALPAGRSTIVMRMIANLFRSSLGKKYIMAVTGFVLFLFIVGHLAGNLQIFFGPETLNRYGYFLHENVELLWPVRVVLLILFLLHVWSSIVLSLENKAARPVPYTLFRPIGSTYASRTMLISGLILLGFLLYHLLHYTADVPAVNLTGQDFHKFLDKQDRSDVYRMLVVGFSNPWVVLLYVIGVGWVCLHLSHGVSSMFQSMGWRNDAYRPLLDGLARIIAVLIFLGYVSIPTAVLLFHFGKDYAR